MWGLLHVGSRLSFWRNLTGPYSASGVPSRTPLAKYISVRNSSEALQIVCVWELLHVVKLWHARHGSGTHVHMSEECVCSTACVISIGMRNVVSNAKIQF